MYLVYRDNAWVEVAKPEQGERFRQTTPTGGTIESFWSDPVFEDANTKITRLAFKQRFTQAERIAIRTAAAQSPEVFDFEDLVNSATYIDLSRADTIGGVNQLEAAGLIGQGRADVILNTPVTEEEAYRG